MADTTPRQIPADAVERVAWFAGGPYTEYLFWDEASARAHGSILRKMTTWTLSEDLTLPEGSSRG